MALSTAIDLSERVNLWPSAPLGHIQIALPKVLWGALKIWYRKVGQRVEFLSAGAAEGNGIFVDKIHSTLYFNNIYKNLSAQIG